MQWVPLSIGFFAKYCIPRSFLDQYAAAESVDRVTRAEKASKEVIEQRTHLKCKKIAKQKEKASVEDDLYVASHFGF